LASLVGAGATVWRRQLLHTFMFSESAQKLKSYRINLVKQVGKFADPCAERPKWRHQIG